MKRQIFSPSREAELAALARELLPAILQRSYVLRTQGLLGEHDKPIRRTTNDRVLEAFDAAVTFLSWRDVRRKDAHARKRHLMELKQKRKRRAKRKA